MERNTVYCYYILAYVEPAIFKKYFIFIEKERKDISADQLAVWAETSLAECKVSRNQRYGLRDK